MSDSSQPSPPVTLCRLPVEKAQPAVQFLHERGGGVMDLIAHFWERLAQTPPLLRQDLHLVVAAAGADHVQEDLNILKEQTDPARFCGAMLYVPKAHRADVLALTEASASAFVRYISAVGQSVLESSQPPAAAEENAQGKDETAPTATLAREGGREGTVTHGKIAIDFLTGGAEGVEAMVPQLLPLVHKRAPARQMVNVVMQLPLTANAALDPAVRLARDTDAPVLNRWRKLYKEERGILFDADVDAWIHSQRVFVCEHANQVVALAKWDLELNQLVEIGGVFTFPEFRQHGFGARIVEDLAARIRQLGKTPTLQVDRENTPALHLYRRHGWVEMGTLARVWLTG